jgi:hypothetical protein
MEIDVTRIVEEMTPLETRAVSGGWWGAYPDPDVRKLHAWQEALSLASKHDVLNTPQAQGAMRTHLLGYGAWEGEEIADMTAIELTALLVQLIAGDMHEGELHAESTEEDWARYEEDGVAGRVPWNLFRGDDGRFYYDFT